MVHTEDDTMSPWHILTNFIYYKEIVKFGAIRGNEKLFWDISLGKWQKDERDRDQRKCLY